MAPSKSTYFLCGQIFSTLYCTHNKQYSGNYSLPLPNWQYETGGFIKFVFYFHGLKTSPGLWATSPIRSGVIYKIQCPRCAACYVGATTRHVLTRFKEQRDTKVKSVYKHLVECDARNALSEEHNLDILCSTLRGEVHLLTLEALWIRDIKPSMNVKDEYRSRELTIKF